LPAWEGRRSFWYEVGSGIVNERLLILDGGTGRELARIGAPFAQPEWSALSLIEAPEYVARVHQSYVDAGADIITTNSYALVPFHIGEERFAARGGEPAALAGRLAREVADGAGRKVLVAGSLPPVCGSYRPDLVDLDKARPILAVLIAALAPLLTIGRQKRSPRCLKRGWWRSLLRPRANRCGSASPWKTRRPWRRAAPAFGRERCRSGGAGPRTGGAGAVVQLQPARGDGGGCMLRASLRAKACLSGFMPMLSRP
jgi:hypothetical protein